MKVMASESGIKPASSNSAGSAAGLIQFTNISLREMKQLYDIDVTLEQLSKMSAIEQLDYVYKYLKILQER